MAYGLDKLSLKQLKCKCDGAKRLRQPRSERTRFIAARGTRVARSRAGRGPVFYDVHINPSLNNNMGTFGAPCSRARARA